MNWFESLIYGLLTGITSLLPVSSAAHQHLLLRLFGENTVDPVQDLFVHIGLLAALLMAGRSIIDQLRRQQIHTSRARSGAQGALETRFLKNAIFPFAIAFLALIYGIKIKINLAWIALFSLLNGFLMFAQGRMMQGNKNERFMSFFDSIAVGICGALAAFPGISRVSAMLTLFTARGVSRQKAASWTILLSIPAFALYGIVDVIRLFSRTGDFALSGNVIGYILAALGAYAAGYASVLIMKSISVKRDYSGFSYYSWGIALFSFVLYLTIV